MSSRVAPQAPAGHNRPTTTVTMVMQCRHQTRVPLSWPQNQEMAPMTQGSVAQAKSQQASLSPMLMMYWEHHIGGEGGGGDVGG
eukprot:15167799-Ditylum_brightwellii.AAC.1